MIFSIKFRLSKDSNVWNNSDDDNWDFSNNWESETDYAAWLSWDSNYFSNSDNLWKCCCKILVNSLYKKSGW